MRERLHRQLRANTCGVATLRTVLHLQFGVQLREEVLEALGTQAQTPIRDHGSTTADFRRMVHTASRAFNTGPRWRFRCHRRAQWADLFRERSCGRFPIVQVHGSYVDFRAGRAEDYHVVVVLDVDGVGDQIKVFDPATDRVHRLPWATFRRWWAVGGDTWYGVVTGGRLVELGGGA